MPHKLTLTANSNDPNEPAQGFNVVCLVDDKPFSATKVTVVAEAGLPTIKAILEIGVSELLLDVDAEVQFAFRHSDNQDPTKALEALRNITDLINNI